MIGRQASLLAICVLMLLAAATMVASGCGSPEPEPQEVSLQINWFHEAEFVGYYVADAQGFYKDEGINVSIREGGPGIQARLHVLDGRSDFAVASFGELRGMVAEGQPAVAIMSVFQIPPLVLFSLADSGIREPRDIVGRRVGVKNDYWRGVVHQTLQNAGLDPAGIVEVAVEADAKELLYSGEVEVWTGYAHDEPIEATVAGYEVNTIYPADYGVGGYEGLLLVNQDMLRRDRDLVTRFLRASVRGWQYAVEHADEAATVMTQWQPKDSLEFQRLAVRALIPLVDVPQSPIGGINDDRWRMLMGEAFNAENPGYTMELLEGMD